jgi:hypothetical protein
MFQLKLATTEITDSTLQISWCVDEETIKHLAEEKVSDPQVVIVVAPAKNSNLNKERRFVVPMKDLLAYVTFKCSGDNRIFAFVCKSSKSMAKDTWLSRDREGYVSWVLRSGGDNYLYPDSLLNADPLTVSVPKECFAKMPSQLEQDWVNLFWDSKSPDQCDFRRRRLFAYGPQFIIMLLNMLMLRFPAFLIALLIGTRGLTIKPLLHPLTTRFFDQWDNIGKDGSIFIQNLGRLFNPMTPREFWYCVIRKFWALPLMPVFSVPLGLLLFLGKFHMLLIIVAVLAIALVCIAFAICLTYWGNNGTWDRIFKAIGTVVHRLLSRKSQTLYDPWYLNKDELDYLNCAKRTQPFTFSNLPPAKKSIALRFRDLKSKVCKPFSA